MRIAIAKEAFNRKMSVLTSKLNIELKKKLVRCYVWSIALYGSETRTLRKLERKYFDSFEMWYWRRINKIKLSGNKFLNLEKPIGSVIFGEEIASLMMSLKDR